MGHMMVRMMGHKMGRIVVDSKMVRMVRMMGRMVGSIRHLSIHHRMDHSNPRIGYS